MVKEKMKLVRDEILTCKNCALHLGRIKPVIGQGDHCASIMFIGDMPNKEEDKTGIPFIGETGKLLNKQLERIGLKREDVYITNIIKCITHNDEQPTKEQKESCLIYLLEQIDIIQPKIIVTFGHRASDFIFKLFGHEPSNKMADIINTIKEPSEDWKLNCINNGDIVLPNLKFMAILHPDSILHNPMNIKKYEEGFNKLKEFINEKK